MQTSRISAILLAACVSACNSNTTDDAIGGGAQAAMPMPGITFLDAGSVNAGIPPQPAMTPAAVSFTVVTPPAPPPPMKVELSVACDLTRTVQSDSSAQINVECLAAGSGIRMADGSERAIEQVVAGDLVLAFDDAAAAPVPARVSRALIRRDARELIIINGSLAATPNHAFHTTRGIRRAEELHVGDTLLRLSSADARGVEYGQLLVPVEITELTQRHGPVLTYNLEVDSYHNYFADGLLVSDH